jgi:hypothetical protein
MKKILLLIPLLFLLGSCEVEGDLTHTKANVPIEPTSVLKYSGDFMPTSGINVTGQAKIYLEGTQYKVKLENFTISDGPDLKVYLSKADHPSEFVNLGNLTSATVYEIPQQVNVAAYSHVLIHCQQYNHLFAIAALTAN